MNDKELQDLLNELNDDINTKPTNSKVTNQII